MHIYVLALLLLFLKENKGEFGTNSVNCQPQISHVSIPDCNLVYKWILFMTNGI